MGFFDIFKRKPALSDPADLKEALMRAVRGGDGASFERLCRDHEERIVELFPSWTKLDRSGTPDRAEIDAMIHFLGTTADYFAQVFGRNELWERLAGPPEDNPLVRWEQALARARELFSTAAFDEAIALLTRTLETTESLIGSGADNYRPKTYGLLGACYFHSGRAEEAKPALERALSSCIDTNDLDGQCAYRSSLFEAHRYLGETREAADHAARLSELLRSKGEEAEAEWYARQASIVARGEPLVRMVVRSGKQRWEVDEVSSAEAEQGFEVVFYRNRLSLHRVETLLSAGAALAAKGDLEQSLELFEEAATIDPFDPQPHYEAGVALLELGRASEAIASFERTELLAPGWFLCRQYLWLAREIASRRLDAWAIPAALSVRDDAPTSFEERIRFARDGLDRAPSFEWLYVALGRALCRVKHESAERELRAAVARVREPCFEAELLFELANCLPPSSEEREMLLARVIELEGTLMTATAARLIRARRH